MFLYRQLFLLAEFFPGFLQAVDACAQVVFCTCAWQLQEELGGPDPDRGPHTLSLSCALRNDTAAFAACCRSAVAREYVSRSTLRYLPTAEPQSNVHNETK